MAAIKSVLCSAIKVALQASCIDDIDPADDALVGLVVLGRYASSVVVKKIVIEVHPQHPLGPERQERKSSQGERQQDGYEWYLPAETMGGVRFRWYRGTVQIRYHLRLDREDALPIIQTVVERVRQTLETSASLIGLTDDFDNRIHALEVTDDYAFTNEAGDPATERVFVDWRAMVTSPRLRA